MGGSELGSISPSRSPSAVLEHALSGTRPRSVGSDELHHETGDPINGSGLIPPLLPPVLPSNSGLPSSQSVPELLSRPASATAGLVHPTRNQGIELTPGLLGADGPAAERAPCADPSSMYESPPPSPFASVPATGIWDLGSAMGVLPMAQTGGPINGTAGSDSTVSPARVTTNMAVEEGERPSPPMSADSQPALHSKQACEVSGASTLGRRFRELSLGPMAGDELHAFAATVAVASTPGEQLSSASQLAPIPSNLEAPLGAPVNPAIAQGTASLRGLSPCLGDLQMAFGSPPEGSLGLSCGGQAETSNWGQSFELAGPRLSSKGMVPGLGALAADDAPHPDASRYASPR